MTEIKPPTLKTTTHDELRLISQLEKEGGTQLLPAADLRKLSILSETLARSDLVPHGMQGKAENIMLAMLHAHGLGLDPFRSLQNMYVIKGRVAIFGELWMGLVTGFPDYGGHREWYEFKDGDKWVETKDPIAHPDRKDLTAVCVVLRQSMPTEYEGRFSVGQAQQAGLWMRKSKAGEDTPWVSYWPDMLMWKARRRAFEQAFSRRLAGVTLYEDVAELAETERAARAKEITPGRKRVRDILRPDEETPAQNNYVDYHVVDAAAPEGENAPEVPSDVSEPEPFKRMSSEQLSRAHGAIQDITKGDIEKTNKLVTKLCGAFHVEGLGDIPVEKADELFARIEEWRGQQLEDTQ